VSRRELEKLALYCKGQKSVSLDDVRAVMGDEAEARSEEASDAAGSGDFARLDLALERLWIAEISAVAVIRGAMGHFQRLAQVKENIERGENLDTALKKLRPPLHFLRADSFKAQLRVWNGEKLNDALDMLLDAETLTKTTAVPNEAVCGRTLMNIAAMAKGRN
jgi:DNA polymerase-3 subunit delta